MGLIFTKALNLTEEEVRFAIKFTKSNLEAARLIGCHPQTWKLYAEKYIDKSTKQSLYKLHTNQSGKGMTAPDKNEFKPIDLFEILDGKHPNYYSLKVLANRLINECIFPEECSLCGFNERRITDFKVPLIFVHKDGDETNHIKDNLEFLCYNCYFLTYGDLKNPLYYLKMKRLF